MTTGAQEKVLCLTVEQRSGAATKSALCCHDSHMAHPHFCLFNLSPEKSTLRPTTLEFL